MIEQKKYRAFISYSHADEAWGGWLQRRLERYRAPGALGQALKERGASARLSPVFRDRDDLPAGDDLNQAIQQALAESEFQIVICSPRAAKSRWVNEEAKLFYKLHGPGRTLAIIVDGEPGASATPGREDEECLPPALRFRLDADGNLTGETAEPIAADARESGDGKNNAFLKIAAYAACSASASTS
ncbi:MAG: toll/interleukin-1 receptor domain-containing protein [Parvularculaceae bacterium]